MRKDLVSVLRQWQSVAGMLFSELEKDAAKEYSGDAATGFGIDGGQSEAEADFVSVRGTLPDDALILTLRKSAEEFRQKVSDIVSLL